MEVMQQITRIEAKIQQLTAKVAQLQSANYELRLENEELKYAVHTANQHADSLTANLNRTRGALEKKRASDPKSIQQLRKQVAEQIKELDQVITTLQESK